MTSGLSIHSLVLFSISKAISNNSTVGVLLGSKTDRMIEVHAAFELVMSDSGIDLDFYNNRLQQYLTVSPEYQKLGIYIISNSITPDERCLNLASNLNSSLLLMVNKEADAIESSPLFMKGYYNQQPIATIVQSDEMESISLSTIIKYNKYFNGLGLKQTSFFSADDSKKNVLLSIDQLLKKVQQIIDYCDSNHGDMDVYKCVEVNNMIAQLSKKLKNMKSYKKDFDNTDRLIANELALLTKKFALLDKSHLNVSGTRKKKF